MAFGSLPSVLGSGGGTAYSLIGGTGLFADGTAAAPSISFAADTDTGFYRNSANQIAISLGGTFSTYFAAGGYIYGAHGANTIRLGSAGEIVLAAAGTNQNITLTPSGTGQTQLTNVTVGSVLASATYGKVIIAGPPVSTVPTLFLTNSSDCSVIFDFPSAFVGRIRTNTGAENLAFGIATVEYGRLNTNGRWLLGTTTDSGALLQVGTNTTTSAGGMVFGTDVNLYRYDIQGLAIGVSLNPKLAFIDGGVNVAEVQASGNVAYFTARNAAGSIQLRTNGTTTALTLDASQHATFAGNVTAGASSQFGWTGKSSITTPSDGVIKISNASGTDFTRLQFGGTTASFPAIQRSTTGIAVVVADGSAFTKITSAAHTIVGAAATSSAGEVSYGATTATTVGAAGGASLLPATPLGYIIVNVAGTAAKIPYYNS